MNSFTNIGIEFPCPILVLKVSPWMMQLRTVWLFLTEAMPTRPWFSPLCSSHTFSTPARIWWPASKSGLEAFPVISVLVSAGRSRSGVREAKAGTESNMSQTGIHRSLCNRSSLHCADPARRPPAQWKLYGKRGHQQSTQAGLVTLFPHYPTECDFYPCLSLNIQQILIRQFKPLQIIPRLKIGQIYHTIKIQK